MSVACSAGNELASEVVRSGRVVQPCGAVESGSLSMPDQALRGTPAPRRLNERQQGKSPDQQPTLRTFEQKVQVMEDVRVRYTHLKGNRPLACQKSSAKFGTQNLPQCKHYSRHDQVC